MVVEGTVYSRKKKERKKERERERERSTGVGCLFTTNGVMALLSLPRSNKIIAQQIRFDQGSRNLC